MSKINHNISLAEKRKRRVRGKIQGTAQRPRLTIYKSNKNTYLQAINDETGVTIASSNNLALKKSGEKLAGTKIEQAVLIAKNLYTQLKDKKINALRFDRGSYKYHGRLKAVAEELRKSGIEV
jgi:large subunit ribosomal protein L18